MTEIYLKIYCPYVSLSFQMHKRWYHFDELYTWVAVPRKQLNQDFSTNMLLKIKVGIRLVLKMAPNIPQCTLKVISIQLGPPFHFNGGKNGEKGESAREKVVRSWLMFSLKLLIFTNFTSVRHMPIFLGEIIHLINISVSSNPQKVI